MKVGEKEGKEILMDAIRKEAELVYFLKCILSNVTEEKNIILTFFHSLKCFFKINLYSKSKTLNQYKKKHISN